MKDAEVTAAGQYRVSQSQPAVKHAGCARQTAHPMCAPTTHTHRENSKCIRLSKHETTRKWTHKYRKTSRIINGQEQIYILWYFLKCIALWNVSILFIGFSLHYLNKLSLSFSCGRTCWCWHWTQNVSVSITEYNTPSNAQNTAG